MPKYYCDYCDIYLTHDSPSVRKSHVDGWKHKTAVRQFYAMLLEELSGHSNSTFLIGMAPQAFMMPPPQPNFGVMPPNMPPNMPHSMPPPMQRF